MRHRQRRNSISSIGLSLQASSDLDSLLNAQSDPSSPLYHHYLTTQQFEQRYAPSQKTVDAVVAYLKSQGLHIDSIAANRLFISVSGTVSVAENAFDTKLQQYKDNDRTIYAPAVDPSVPDNIGGVIESIGGLDNVAKYHPLGLHSQAANPVAVKGYTPTQLRTAYNVQPLIDASAKGPSQTVALFELDGYNPSDVNTYLQKYNLGAPKYLTVLVDGSKNKAGSGSVEVVLDMEVISAIAPNAKQVVYIAPNSTVGVNDMYNKIVSDNVAKVTSISWGECESAAGNAQLQALDNIFAQGAAQGQSFFAATGDSGAYDCGNGQLGVDSPSDDPHVVGVGGTSLQINSNGGYVSESAWSTTSRGQRAGGGGGVSSYFASPSYQSGTNAKRTVPDVSADADPATGYSIYCSSNATYCNGWSVIGGTSAAAPLWAAIATNTNQYLASKKEPLIGNVNAALYTISKTSYPTAAYHDVTTGTNLYYKAGPGYDMATGFGSPDAWNFARDLEVM